MSQEDHLVVLGMRWARGGLLSPTMFTEAAVIPRAVLDLGLRVDVQEGALLVAAFPCRKCGHIASWNCAGTGSQSNGIGWF